MAALPQNQNLETLRAFSIFFCALKWRPLSNHFHLGVILLRKEVIQPQVPLRLPCYDFTPITNHTLGACLPEGLASATSGTADFRGVTGGVYKARERIHRGVLIRDY